MVEHHVECDTPDCRSRPGPQRLCRRGSGCLLSGGMDRVVERGALRAPGFRSACDVLMGRRKNSGRVAGAEYRCEFIAPGDQPVASPRRYGLEKRGTKNKKKCLPAASE